MNIGEKFFFERRETIRLDTLRVCLGLSLLLYMSFRWQFAGEWLTSDGFHVSSANLPYHDFAVPLLPRSWLLGSGLLFFGSIICLIVGWQIRLSCLIALICLIYVTAADQLSAFSPNKILIASLCIILCAPLGRHWSLGGAIERNERPVWAIRIFQMTLVIHLFMAGWTKIMYGEWLQNGYVLWTQIQGTFRTDFAAYLLKILPMEAWVWMQCSALLFEILAPILFCFKRLRWLGFVWGGVFQVMIALTMQHFIYFNLIIFCLFVVFISDETLLQCERTVLSRFRLRSL